MTTRDTATTVASYYSKGSRSKGNPKTQYSSMGMGMSINPQHTILEKIAKCTKDVCEPRLCNPNGKRANENKKGGNEKERG